MHQWSYFKSGLMGDTQVGPVSEKRFAIAVRNGEIKRATKVHSLTRTDGQWVLAESVPTIVSMRKQNRTASEQGDRDRVKKKQATKMNRNAAKTSRDATKATKRKAKEESKKAARLELQKRKNDQAQQHADYLSSPRAQGEMLESIRDTLWKISSNISVICIILVILTILSVISCAVTMGQ